MTPSLASLASPPHEYFQLAGQRNNSEELGWDQTEAVRVLKPSTATVSIDRIPIGACFGEPVHEFDPRPVRHNIGDAQLLFVLR